MTSIDDQGIRNSRRRLSPAEYRFMNGKSDEVPPGLLTDHETWLATDAPAEALVDAGLCEELEDADLVRRGLVEEARWRLADQSNYFERLREQARAERSDLRPMQGSLRTQQRRIKRYHEEIKALRNRRRPGPVMSVETAATKVKAEWDFKTGRWFKTCAVCGKAFTAWRSDAKTCGPKCRKRLSTGAVDRHRWLGRDFRASPQPERH